MGWSTPSILSATLLSLIALKFYGIVRRLIHDRIERRGYPLPPGPIPVPFLGSFLSVDAEEPFKTYTAWRAKYGDIMYMQSLGVDVVIPNSSSVAGDQLEKRSQIYSDRPFMPTVDAYGQDCNFAFTRYGDFWRLCRRIFHQTFRAEAVVAFHPIQLRKSRQLILNMMDNPKDYLLHYWTYSAGVSMTSIYDYDPQSHGDPMVSTIHNFLEHSFPEMTIEKTVLLETFPFLLHIPDWLPGSSMKHKARMARKLGNKTVDEPYMYVRKRMKSGDDVNISMVPSHLSRVEMFDDTYHPQYELALKRACTTGFIGSVETTSSSLTTFTLAMVRNPHIWKRAQGDIDAVVGTDRLPDFDDRPSLPFIDAILRETLRWQPALTLGVPHATIASDIYNGYYIPKGATIVGNAWAMSRDEVRYPNAEEFIPDRFLDAEGKLTNDFPDFVFGFGRRVCPGRHAVDASLWIAIVTMLATLDFNPARNAHGKDIKFETKFINGLTRYPLAFPCCIAPRPHANKESLLKGVV